MWIKISSIILRYRLALLILLICFTVFMGYQAYHVQLSYEFAKVLPENDPDFIEYQKFKEVFGEDGSVLAIGIKDKNLFELQRFNDWYELGNSIKKIDGIEEVVSLARVYTLEKNDSASKFDFQPVVSRKPVLQPELDSLKNIIFSLPFYEGLIYNKETSATLMAVTLDKKKLNTKNRIALIDSIKSQADKFGEKHNITVHYSGLPYIRTAISRKVANELMMFLVLALVVTSGILLFFFKSFKVALFSLLVVITGVICSVGFIVLFGYKITILTGLIPPLIIVIGVPNCILLLNKYHQEFNKYRNKIRALARTIEKIGITAFLANFTTAIGFGVFCFTHSNILVEFGLVASVNVMLTYLISLVLIPIIFSYLPPPSVRHTAHLQRKNTTGFLNRVDRWVHYYRKRVYLVVAVIIILSIIGLTKINTIGYMVDDLPKNDPVYRDMKFFESNFHGVLPFEISIDTRSKNGVFADNAKTLYKIKTLQKIINSYPEFSKPVSIVEAINFAYQAYKDGNPKYYILPPPPELGKLKAYISNSTQQKKGTFHSFIDSNSQITRISVQMADVGSVKMKKLLKEIRQRTDSVFSPQEYTVKYTGNSVIFSEGNEYLLINLQESILLAVVLIAMVMFALFFSARMILVSMLPSLIPLLITAGLMGYFHIPLKPSTILIFSIAFGIASDGTLYFLTKYKQELIKNNWSISKTVSITIRETGMSMIYTAVILFAGFAIFTASDFGGTAALGILISVTLLIAYCSNLVLLPAILLSLEKVLVTRAFLREPLIQVYDEEDDVETEQLKIEKKQHTAN